MSPNLVALLYLVAGVLFILALRGLSSPDSSRRGNLFGMIGIAIGGSIGAVIARRVPMTSMPELVAAFHSLVGMAAVLVAAGAFYAPAAFDIGTHGHIHQASLIEMALGVAIAFLKLSGKMSGAPIILPARHVVNVALFLGLIYFVYDFYAHQTSLDF